jgi:light-regulated signal transduction histidine kinase (bacteriophytochrome)
MVDTIPSPEEHATAILNMLEDFSEDKLRVEQTQHAVLNILDDFSQEKRRLEDTQRATLNLLEDFDAERSKMENMQHALLNILGDFAQDKSGLETAQRATLNLLEDFDAERLKAEHVSRELEQSVERLRVAKETADASNRELDAFSYSVSHDLRAPVRHILGFSKILIEEYESALPPEAQKHLQRIQTGAERMGQLVDALLSLARLGRQGLRFEVTNLKKLVEEVIAELSPDVALRQVEWKIGDLPSIDCDASLVRQVFQNLFSNALKFTRTRTPAVIEVGLTRQAGNAGVVFVRDNGVGFNMKYSDKLFGVFQRLHRVEDFEGTGVGLATVNRIIQKHGGCIWAEAQLDKGAAFYFTLGASENAEFKSKVAKAGGKA